MFAYIPFRGVQFNVTLVLDEAASIENRKDIWIGWKQSWNGPTLHLSTVSNEEHLWTLKEINLTHAVRTGICHFITVMYLCLLLTTHKSSKEMAPPTLAELSSKCRVPPISTFVCCSVNPPPRLPLKMFFPLNMMGYLKLNTALFRSAWFPTKALKRSHTQRWIVSKLWPTNILF